MTALEQAGSSVSLGDSVVDDLANTHGHNAMRTLQSTLEKTGLKLPVEICEMDRPDCENIPWTSLSSWIQYLVQSNELSRLYGGLPDDIIGEVLEELWKLYREIEPDLEIYEEFDAGRADPRTTIMMTSHQDEGRGNSVLI